MEALVVILAKNYVKLLVALHIAKSDEEKEQAPRKPFTRGEKLSWLLTLVAFIFLFIPQLMLQEAYGYNQLDAVDKTLWWVVGIWVQLFIALGFGTFVARAKIKQELNLR